MVALFGLCRFITLHIPRVAVYAGDTIRMLPEYPAHYSRAYWLDCIFQILEGLENLSRSRDGLPGSVSSKHAGNPSTIRFRTISSRTRQGKVHPIRIHVPDAKNLIDCNATVCRVRGQHCSLSTCAACSDGLLEQEAANLGTSCKYLRCSHKQCDTCHWSCSSCSRFKYRTLGRW